MHFAVGCPVWQREWVMGEWFAHVERAATNAGLVPSYVFVADPSDPTFSFIHGWCSAADRELVWCHCAESPSTPVGHTWTRPRYERMAFLRNQLLAVVRAEDPQWFLSLDSDILLHPDALGGGLELARGLTQPFDAVGLARGLTQPFDAVGLKTYLGRVGQREPNYAFLRGAAGLGRFDSDGTFPVEVIMAAKLMNRVAYHVDYVAHMDGEDVGWSINANRAGVRLGWDGRHASKHIMRREQLHQVDGRVGW